MTGEDAHKRGSLHSAALFSGSGQRPFHKLIFSFFLLASEIQEGAFFCQKICANISSANDYLETCQVAAASLSPSAVEWELSVTSIDGTREKAERMSEIRLYSVEVQPSSGEHIKLFIAARAGAGVGVGWGSGGRLSPEATVLF